MQGSLLRSRGSYEVWGKPLRHRVDAPAAADGGHVGDAPAVAVVLFNKGDVATNVTLRIAGHGDYGESDIYPAGVDGTIVVRDLLKKEDLPARAHPLGELTMLVPPTDAVMLQVRAA